MCHTHIRLPKKNRLLFLQKKNVQMKLDDRGNMKKNTVCYFVNNRIDNNTQTRSFLNDSKQLIASVKMWV